MSGAPPWSGLRLTSVAAALARPAPRRPLRAVAVPPDAPAARARAAGHAEPVVARLERALETLPAAQRRAVLDPLGRLDDVARGGGAPVRRLDVGGVPARQVDGTTCGSAVLALLAAAGDPVLALWLQTGATPGDTADGRGPAGSPGAGGPEAAAERWRHLQRVVKRRTSRGALGPFPWPGALGTPPWGAARTARYAGVRYTHRMVGTDAGAVLEVAVHAAARGIPVPLFTGGDLSGGLAAAVPRHVVLLTAVGPAGRCWVYEPSSGTVHRLGTDRLTAGATDAAVRRALGGWPHLVWALLPTGAAPSPADRTGDRDGAA